MEKIFLIENYWSGHEKCKLDLIQKELDKGGKIKLIVPVKDTTGDNSVYIVISYEK